MIKSDNANTNGTSIITKMHLKRTKNWQARMTKRYNSFFQLILFFTFAHIFILRCDLKKILLDSNYNFQKLTRALKIIISFRIDFGRPLLYLAINQSWQTGFI